MYALVASAVLPALFIGSGVLALTALVGTWRAYAGAYARLRGELVGVRVEQDVRIVVTRHEIRALGGMMPALRGRRPITAMRPQAPAALPVISPARPAAA